MAYVSRGLARPAGVCVNRGSLAIGVTSNCAGGRARGISCVIGRSERSRVRDTAAADREPRWSIRGCRAGAWELWRRTLAANARQPQSGVAERGCCCGMTAIGRVARSNSGRD
jgi:hypothetical protein